MTASLCPAIFAIIALCYLATAAAVDMPPGQYLTKYDYMGKRSPDLIIGALTDPAEKFKMALKKFQRMANIAETGEMNDDTRMWMSYPRCGVPDELSMGDVVRRRRRRYAKQGSKWGKNDLTYKILNYSPDFAQGTQRGEIQRAFRAWAAVTPLTFREVAAWQVADIEIKFAAGSHGDAFPFDGRGGTLAHAFFPQFGGDVHMDESETFSANSYSGTNMFQVLTHELGHSLGLGHSSDAAALMAPFYRGYQPSFQLHTDDIRGVQSIYGGPGSASTTPAPTRGPTAPPPTAGPTAAPGPGSPSWCTHGQFDVVSRVDDKQGSGVTYAFRGDECAKLNNFGVEAGYPRAIRSEFPGLPDDLDAALYWAAKDGNVARTYFFKGTKYWRYQMGAIQPGYPRSIAGGFPGMPTHIDTAFVWSGNGKTYFTKGGLYYRYKRGTGVDAGYPKSLGVWRGLPDRINAAFQWQNGRTYFFAGPNYYRFHDGDFKVDTGYPRLNSVWWLGCSDTSGNVAAAGMEMSEHDDQFMEVGVGTGSTHRLPIASFIVIMVAFVLSW